MIAFGPVPSRRLGRSLGIDDVPLKGSPYSWVHCQWGRTIHRQLKAQACDRPEQILREVPGKVRRVQKKGESIDDLTFIPRGGPHAP